MSKAIFIFLTAISLFCLYKIYDTLTIQQRDKVATVKQLEKNLQALKTSDLSTINTQEFDLQNNTTFSLYKDETYKNQDGIKLNEVYAGFHRPKCIDNNTCTQQELELYTELLIQENMNKSSWSNELIKWVLYTLGIFIVNVGVFEYTRFRNRKK